LPPGYYITIGGVWLLLVIPVDWLLPNAPRYGAVPTKDSIERRVATLPKFRWRPSFRFRFPQVETVRVGRAGDPGQTAVALLETASFRGLASDSDRIVNENESQFNRNFLDRHEKFEDLFSAPTDVLARPTRPWACDTGSTAEACRHVPG
jgi:hypothetical protein